MGNLLALLTQQDAFKEEKEGKAKMSQYWGGQQRFFKGLMIGAKVKRATKLTREALARGESVVISLWTTNESVITKHGGVSPGDAVLSNDGFLSGPELTVEFLL